MAILVLPDNGQKVELDDTIAQSDELVRQALSVAYPAAANATITRTTGENGVMVVNVVKQAGQKGAIVADVLDYLRLAPEEVNPALTLALELKLLERQEELTPVAGMALQPRISHATTEGTRQLNKVQAVLNLLANDIAPQPAQAVPDGF